MPVSERARGQGAGARIATYAASASTALDACTLDAVARSLADTYAVAVGGAREHAVRAALAYVEDAGLLSAPDAPHAATVWGTGRRAPPEIAAWCNGIAGHVLDYDDVTVPLRGHPSIALWPAVLALAEARNISGARAASAFVVGMEVLCKLGRCIAVDQYAAGWHTTASIGALGSTAACAHLMRLDADQTINAIGLAVAQVAGSRENVGTEAKSFQAGQACAVGVRAAGLALAGFGAGAGALDGPHGYAQLYAAGANLTAMPVELGQAPLEIHRAGLDVKQYPMCYATHRALDAVLALRREHGLRAADVRHVTVTTSRAALTPLVHPRPSSGLEGKFSMQYAMAAALIDGQVRLASFTDEAVRRPEARWFFDRVNVREAEGPITPRWATVELDLADGRQLALRVETLGGSHQKPLDDAQLASKINDCLRWGHRGGDGKTVLAHCRRLAQHDGRAFMDGLSALAGGGRA
ncbi:MmgE/PrpD family protein [Bordetella petrii]|uniref:MmgE/PrpD family protein n=1 Tax=Bordetella petrii TaxID=94624 RepID=UPI001E5B2BFB|nr:MmgE/PrpD family protein [Bordetella petrii]MCD0502483.1 MmgE/PrpD family protein [Bordetella petrii]